MHWMLMAVLALLTAGGAWAEVPATSEPVSFPPAGADAPLLVGELSLPVRPNAGARVPGVVVCHPDPAMGGTMDNIVVIAIRDDLLRRGIAVLRFNFRGTGGSAGEHSGGVREPQDVLGALEFLRAQPAVRPRRVALAGYSFGSRMAAEAMARDPRGLAGAFVGFPTGLEEIAPEEWGFLARIERPMWLVTGDSDQYSSILNLVTLQVYYGLDAQVVELEGADHFFVDADTRAAMADEVGSFLSQKLLAR